MEPHQQRVVDEKKELDDKISKLDSFIGTETFNLSVDRREQGRLKVQLGIMRAYSLILEERIAAFPE